MATLRGVRAKKVRRSRDSALLQEGEGLIRRQKAEATEEGLVFFHLRQEELRLGSCFSTKLYLFFSI